MAPPELDAPQTPPKKAPLTVEEVRAAVEHRFSPEMTGFSEPASVLLEKLEHRSVEATPALIEMLKNYVVARQSLAQMKGPNPQSQAPPAAKTQALPEVAPQAPPTAQTAASAAFKKHGLKTEGD